MQARPFRASTLLRSLCWLVGKTAAVVALPFFTFAPSEMAASTLDVEVRSKPIVAFSTKSSQKRFGQLELVGGLIFTSPEPLFGAISSIRFQPDGKDFIAVLDTGHWMSGQVERNADGVLSGLSHVKIDPILDETGNEARRKRDMDAEGLALRGDTAFVSFEQFPRIGVFSTKNLAAATPTSKVPHLLPDQELRRNAGMETLVLSPASSPLQGALVTVTEASVDSRGNLYAAVLDGPRKGIFFVAKDPSFSVTDGAFLENGDLLLLERRFNLAEGVGMRLRRISADTIKPGAVVDGPILLEADLSHQIDNMEGLDVVKGADGSTRLIFVSDDNHSFLQRSLMLEFKLID